MKSYWNPSVNDETTQDNSWNNPDNWKPQEKPADIAAFNSAAVTEVTFDTADQAEIKGIEFEEGAQAFTFNFSSSTAPLLTITGEGVLNHSGLQQSFVIAAKSSGFHEPQLVFSDKATAGGDDLYYCIGPENRESFGGGVLRFVDTSNAGSARFKIWTGAGIPPKKGSTVGGEVAFSNSASAANARFVIYGTLGVDGDTFGNVVFHDTTTAGSAIFENIGGTVSGGDGGNTQFYGTSSAANGIYHNFGGTYSKANGGDVAFDTQADGGQGTFHNYAAPAEGAYGGVTSFNNNWPDVDAKVASTAAKGTYINYGARGGQLGGGGHLSFSAKYGSPTAAEAFIENYGSDIAAKSSAGHTIFSITLPSSYVPTAANATIYNHPALGREGAAGYTEFAVFTEKGKTSPPSDTPPTAGCATLINLGGYCEGAAGGYTVFTGNSTAANAILIAEGGLNGGWGGKISFYENACGGNAKVKLSGNGKLDLAYHKGTVTIGSLELNGGEISMQLGKESTRLNVSGEVTFGSAVCYISFRSEKEGFALNTSYPILTATNLSQLSESQFEGSEIEGIKPSFKIVDDQLLVSFNK